MSQAAHLRLASESEEAAAIPSLPELYTRAAEKGLLSESDSIRELLWAAVDPDAYGEWAHARLSCAGVPLEHHRFDHDFVVKMVKDKFKPK